MHHSATIHMKYISVKFLRIPLCLHYSVSEDGQAATLQARMTNVDWARNHVIHHLITFYNFRNCDEDYLMLQGDSEATKLCGSNLPEIYNVNGTVLRLSFTSGQQKRNKLGFVAMYSSGKGNET